MTSTPPNTPEMLNARLSESVRDNPPYGARSVTTDSHELSTYSVHRISQREMPTVSMARAMPSENGDSVPRGHAYEIQMKTCEAYCVGYELWHVVEGFSLRQIGENIEFHGGGEFWGCPASNGLRGRELHTASMKLAVGHESEIRRDMRDPDPKPQPQPQPSPHRDPWGYGLSHSEDVFFIKAIIHSAGAFLALVKADTPTVIRGLH